jgi:ATP-dependent Clp protease ATP-binding subunit ClpA
MEMIVRKFINELQSLIKDKTINIIVSPAAMDLLVEQGFDPKMGARPLSRIIDNKIKKPLSREMLFGRLRNGGAVLVDAINNDVILAL